MLCECLCSSVLECVAFACFLIVVVNKKINVCVTTQVCMYFVEACVDEYIYIGFVFVSVLFCCLCVLFDVFVCVVFCVLSVIYCW